jgi:hypothetical protein
VLDVTKNKDEFMVTAVDNRYYEKLTEYQAKLGTQAPSTSGYPSRKSDEELIEDVRNAK